MLVEKQETLKTWQRRIAPCISRHLSIESFVEDVVSPFLHIIAPPNLRPVSVQTNCPVFKNNLLFSVLIAL
jgi:chromosome transmission fidelity protein 18